MGIADTKKPSLSYSWELQENTTCSACPRLGVARPVQDNSRRGANTQCKHADRARTGRCWGHRKCVGNTPVPETNAVHSPLKLAQETRPYPGTMGDPRTQKP